MKAGFYYSGEGDKVICPWCNRNLTEWESYDIPMEEHQKPSPYYAFVLMLNRFLNYHLLQNNAIKISKLCEVFLSNKFILDELYKMNQRDIDYLQFTLN